ncbi:TPA: ATP-binding cassette domain-containing protein [Klebsiella oxytoca]|nr:ATP-binding cassette domain-containing protein [Klebsiella oxytoca]
MSISPQTFLRLDRVSRYQSAPHNAWSKPTPAVAIFEDLSLSLTRFARVGLVGASGCGKSTLLKTLLALEVPDEGAVYCDGIPVRPGSASALRWYRRRVQYIPQDPAGSLAPNQRVADLLSEPLRHLCREKALPARLRDALEQVELSPSMLERRADELSGGQAQRVALARALIIKPDYILADEPFSGLDLPLREQIKTLLSQITEENKMGLMIVSHDISMLAGLCDRILVMENGRIIEDRPTMDVLNTPFQPHTRQLLHAIPVLARP